MVRFYQGVAGRRGRNPAGVVVHNDAASVNATAAYYRAWLPTHNAANGFAHYYVCSDGIYQAELETNMAWHTANSNGNANYVGIEACQSFAGQAIYLNNEERSFKLAAEVLKRYGLRPNKTTVMLHKQFSATACPHRSSELHGVLVSAVQEYHIARITAYMDGTATAQTETPKEEKESITRREDLPMEFLYSAPKYVAYVNGFEFRKFTSEAELATFKAIKDQVSANNGDYVTDKNGNIVKDKNGNPIPQPFQHFNWTKNVGTVTVVERIYKEVQ